MVRAKCSKCGRTHPPGDCPPGNAIKPFDAQAWRKAYMKKYMQKLRARKRAEKAAEQQPKDQAS